ncbi:MAG: hypothetical protein QOK39_2672 [Acidimicrobiaceae bacterium]|jgi:hypothetical protein|nr:hypothetical protein [Acidimicrobiaceae bacterium]
MSDTDLPDFDGFEVRRSAVRITKAGDGLSEALKVQPRALHYGDEVFYILRGKVAQVNHKGDPDEGITRGRRGAGRGESPSRRRRPAAPPRRRGRRRSRRRLMTACIRGVRWRLWAWHDRRCRLGPARRLADLHAGRLVQRRGR